MRRIYSLVVLCALAVGCAASPRQRPLSLDPIASGANTVEAVRRQLEGRWTLISLEVASDDGRGASVEAVGQLELDSFGNLNVQYRLSDQGQKALEAMGVPSPNPIISTTGQAAIDPVKQQITYVAPDALSRAFDPDLAARRNNPFALERVRHYALDEEGVLTLTTRHDNGRQAATSRWRRAT
jgi:hypothetical protein